MSNNQKEESTGFIKTASHNYVSRKADVIDPQKVELKGKCVLKDGVVVRGDLGRVQMGRYVSIGELTTITPCVPMVIRGHVTIGKECTIEAAAIGSFVRIGDACKIGKRCLVKDSCIIEEGTVLGDDTVVPPFSRVKGRPGLVVEELPPSAAMDLQDAALQVYQAFVEDQS
jgi:dynactin 5